MGNLYVCVSCAHWKKAVGVLSEVELAGKKQNVHKIKFKYMATRTTNPAYWFKSLMLYKVEYQIGHVALEW